MTHPINSTNLIIFGTGNFSLTVTRYFERYTDLNIISYVEDQESNNHSSIFNGKPLLTLDTLFNKHPPHSCQLFVAVGYTKMNTVRQKYFELLKGKNYSFANFIHPNVVLWDNCFGENNFVFENNVIQQDVSFGNNNIIWSGNHIGHHSSIGNNNWITSHVVIYSSVTICDNCFLGSNSNIKDGVVISDQCFVGAGSNIWNDSKFGSVYTVKPSKPLSSITSSQIII